MLRMLRKTYTIQVTITEGSDEFWESLRGRSGSDDVVAEVKRLLEEAGFTEPDCYVRLSKFEET